jgi:hypothetical protein
MTDVFTEASVGHRRRLVLECPFCCRESLSDGGHFYFDLRSRRRGFIHTGCFEQVCDLLNLDDDPDCLVALTLDGPGLVGPECRLSVHSFDAEENLVGSEEVELDGYSSLMDWLSMMTGRSLDVAYRELILVDRTVNNAETLLTDSAYRHFALRRRRAVRELRHAGLF